MIFVTNTEGGKRIEGSKEGNETRWALAAIKEAEFLQFS